jgi:hypothetical protein
MYRDRRGQHPESLVDLEPVLSEVTQAQCRIVLIGRDEYQVSIPAGEINVVMEIEYSLGPDGILENFHVESVKRNRVDN